MKNLLSKMIVGMSFLATSAYAQTAFVSLIPSTQHIEVDSPAVVRIHTGAVDHLHAYSIQVTYDPQILRCIGVQNLNYFGTMTFYYCKIDSLGGKISADEAILGPTGQSGAGDFAEIKFVGVRAGSASLMFANSDFRDTTNQKFTVTAQGSIIQVSGTASVTHGPTITDRILLQQNYPNPFNPTTTIRYFQAEDGMTIIRIASILGQEVYSQMSGYQHSGERVFIWDGQDDNGRNVPSGTYILRVQTPTSVASIKMLLIR